MAKILRNFLVNYSNEISSIIILAISITGLWAVINVNNNDSTEFDSLNMIFSDTVNVKNLNDNNVKCKLKSGSKDKLNGIIVILSTIILFTMFNFAVQISKNKSSDIDYTSILSTTV